MMSPMVDKHVCDASSVVVQQPSDLVNFTQFVFPAVVIGGVDCPCLQLVRGGVSIMMRERAIN